MFLWSVYGIFVLSVSLSLLHTEVICIVLLGRVMVFLQIEVGIARNAHVAP